MVGTRGRFARTNEISIVSGRCKTRLHKDIKQVDLFLTIARLKSFTFEYILIIEHSNVFHSNVLLSKVDTFFYKLFYLRLFRIIVPVITKKFSKLRDAGFYLRKKQY